MKKRKPLRLPEYNYAQPNGYFITICTQNQKELFGKLNLSKIHLTKTGLLVEAHLLKIEEIYPDVFIEDYVVMPNHIHALFVLETEGRSISQIIKSFKTAVSKSLGGSIWQKSFYDHVVRSEKDRLRILEYIHNNPAQWELDQLNPSGTNYFNP